MFDLNVEQKDPQILDSDLNSEVSKSSQFTTTKKIC